MKIDVEPLAALCDKKLSISVSGIQPKSKVKLSASMCLPWAKDILYESFAWFTADSDGNVDLSKQKPERGTYDFIDSMGLITSMKSKEANALQKIGQNISVDQSLFIDVVAECGEELESVRLERSFKGKDVKNLKITDKFIGELFYTENPDNKTIIFLGGSGSGLAVNSPMASVLASHGFNVLSLPYFNEKGLPKNLSEIPLEYFEKVFSWLAENPITKCKEIRILGMSKGAELALVLASRYNSIIRVAAIAPHAFCFQGLAFKNVSSWTYGGKQLPYIRLKNRWLIANMLGCFIKNKPFGFAHTYKKGISTAKNKEVARIRVEDSNADLLMFTGKENNMWNSYDGCIQIMDTLKKCNYPNNYDLVVYENTGEPFYVPYILPTGDWTQKMAPRLVLSVGGTLQGNTFAQCDSWDRIIEFFNK